jgi:hypothetical protein
MLEDLSLGQCGLGSFHSWSSKNEVKGMIFIHRGSTEH